MVPLGANGPPLGTEKVSVYKRNLTAIKVFFVTGVYQSKKPETRASRSD